MISLRNARLMRGEQVLLEQTDLTIHKGRKIGVIGRNGSGKTSLFACLTGQIGLDQGDLDMPEGLRIAWMQQETRGHSRSAVDHVIDGDHRYRAVEQRLMSAEQRDDTDGIVQAHSELDRMNAYDIDARARQLLSGLGFSTDEFDRPVSAFSGGWRIRLNLAAALMAPSDLLLLDEPTNHLDLEATLWLEQWLNRYEGTLLIISHDRGFLDRVIDHVISFEDGRLILYRGNYTAYEKQRAERLAQQQAMAEKQQRRRTEIEAFVARFRAQANKARQAQSRLKELDRMQEIAPAHIDSPVSFRFRPADKLPGELLGIDNGVIGIEGHPLVSPVNLRLQPGSRIGLLGLNGSGKSTLLRTLAGRLPLLDGKLDTSRHLRIGYFAQHQVDEMDGRQSALNLLQEADPIAREQHLRNFLGGFDFHGDRVTEPVSNFSGGEKSRLALAIIAWQQPNLLLLDEPTNHLDMEMRRALTVALQEYEGGLVIVSHDRHLLDNTVDEYAVIRDGRFREFDGTLDDYARWLQAQQQVDATATLTAPGHASSAEPPDARSRRQDAAARRQAVAPLRKEVRVLETSIDDLNRRLSGLEDSLADSSLYEPDNKNQLTTLLQQQAELRSELQHIEQQWLEKAAELEEH
ncbi:MAG: ABC-F family ATP-binding cassette domain-containing protein [Pseudomonadota bacterium]